MVSTSTLSLVKGLPGFVALGWPVVVLVIDVVILVGNAVIAVPGTGDAVVGVPAFGRSLSEA